MYNLCVILSRGPADGFSSRPNGFPRIPPPFPAFPWIRKKLYVGGGWGGGNTELEEDSERPNHLMGRCIFNQFCCYKYYKASWLFGSNLAPYAADITVTFKRLSLCPAAFRMPVLFKGSERQETTRAAFSRPACSLTCRSRGSWEHKGPFPCQVCCRLPPPVLQHAYKCQRAGALTLGEDISLAKPCQWLSPMLRFV